jgi:hypothetical protein
MLHGVSCSGVLVRCAVVGFLAVSRAGADWNHEPCRHHRGQRRQASCSAICGAMVVARDQSPPVYGLVPSSPGARGMPANKDPYRGCVYVPTLRAALWRARTSSHVASDRWVEPARWSVVTRDEDLALRSRRPSTAYDLWIALQRAICHTGSITCLADGRRPQRIYNLPCRWQPATRDEGLALRRGAHRPHSIYRSPCTWPSTTRDL